MIMKKIVLSLAALGMVCGVASVSAGELANEFNGQIALGTSKVQNGASNSFGFGSLSYGRFFNPSVEGYVGATYSGSAGSTTTGALIGANYFFTPVGKQGNAAFFVGADVGGSNTSGAGGTSNSTWSVSGGVKYFVSDSASINATVNHSESKPSGGLTTQMDLLLIGASAYF